MINVHYFIFNPFMENSFLVWDETGETVVIDPGCYGKEEQEQIIHYLNTHNLKPVRLVNTHCHVDHIFGNTFISRRFNLPLEINEHDKFMLEFAPDIGKMYDVQVEKQPEDLRFLNEGDTIAFGNSKLEILHTPGHSPGSITFFNRDSKFMIAGDVIFQESIGRTDLPGGDYPVLLETIHNKIMTFPDEFIIYSGHGPATTVGHERNHNPFLKGTN